MIHSFYDLEPNSLDVLCVGSSHAYSSFCPNTLWNEYGMTGYVMSSPQQTAAMSYYLLKEAFQYQKPKVVVFEAYYLFCKEKYTSTGKIRSCFDGIHFGKAKVEAINDFLPDLTWKEKVNYYLPFLMYHSRWDELENYDFNKKPFRKGAFHSYACRPSKPTGMPEKAVDIPEVSMEYLEKIRMFCEENGVELVMYTAPYPYGDEEQRKNNENKLAMNYTLEEYAKEHDLAFFWYGNMDEAGIDYAADYRDEMHTNTYGAEKISRFLGKYMEENCDLPDHREDPEYASWQEDYEKWAEEAERLKK